MEMVWPRAEMNERRPARVALRWTPPGNRNRERPAGTWKRVVEDEMKALRMSWTEAGRLSRDKGTLWNYGLPYAPLRKKRIK